MSEQRSILLLEEWTKTEIERITEQAIKLSKKVYQVYFPIMFLLVVGMLVGLGILVKAPIKQILTLHLGVGLGLFSFTALIMILIYNKARLIKVFLKELKKELRLLKTEEEQVDFAKDMLENGNNNIYTYHCQDHTLRILFGNRFLLQKDMGYYILIDTQAVDKISEEEETIGQGAARSQYYYIDFYFPLTGKKTLFSKTNKKRMRFNKKEERDKVFKRVQSAYTISEN